LILKHERSRAMSQVVKAITAVETNERRIIDGLFSPLFHDVFNVKSHIQQDPATYLTQYKIGVTIGSSVFVEEDFSDTNKNEIALEESINRTKRQVVEAIFGEFRHDFLLIEKALYDRDFLKARDYLAKFQDKMFTDN